MDKTLLSGRLKKSPSQYHSNFPLVLVNILNTGYVVVEEFKILSSLKCALAVTGTLYSVWLPDKILWESLLALYAYTPFTALWLNRGRVFPKGYVLLQRTGKTCQVIQNFRALCSLPSLSPISIFLTASTSHYPTFYTASFTKSFSRDKHEKREEETNNTHKAKQEEKRTEINKTKQSKTKQICFGRGNFQVRRFVFFLLTVNRREDRNIGERPERSRTLGKKKVRVRYVFQSV